MAEPSPSRPSIPEDLSAYRLPSLPPSFYYIPNFLTEYEEAKILSKV
jgi:alkylated DNA repair protein alkB family protein 6